MADNGRRTTGVARECRWVNRAEAFEHFAVHDGPTQSQQHIKPLHWYVTCRLVLEGGFHPDEIKPRPPFIVTGRRGERLIHFDPAAATGGEATILLHITYPALVFGYLFVIRANQAAEPTASREPFHQERPLRQIAPNDIAIAGDGRPVETIVRFHSALGALTGRCGIREDASRYEAVALAMIDMRDDGIGRLLPDFPPPGSPVRIERFFETLYLRYDERLNAPAGGHIGNRAFQSSRSSASVAGPSAAERLQQPGDAGQRDHLKMAGRCGGSPARRGESGLPILRRMLQSEAYPALTQPSRPMAINLAHRRDLDERVERLAARLGLTGRGRKVGVIERALTTLEEQVERDHPDRGAIVAALDRYIDTGSRRRDRLMAGNGLHGDPPLSLALQEMLYDERGLPK